MHREITEDKLRNYCAKGYTTAEMGNALGVPPVTVQLRLNKYGLKPDAAAKFIRKFDRKYGEGALKDILSMRKEGCTLQDIGCWYGISRERVRQILQRCKDLEIR